MAKLSSFEKVTVRGLIGLIVVAWATIAPAQTQLRIMASNLTSDNFQSYQAAGIDILKGLNADVILMQEFNVNTVSGGPNDNAAVAAFVSSTFGPGFQFYRESGAQIPNGIVSRYPILASGNWTDTNVSNRSYAWARIDVPGSKDLYAISVHLLSTSSGNRNAEATELVNTYIPTLGMPAGSYLVIGGDFNTDSRSEACISTFSGTFVTASPYPVGQDGNSNTNANRNKPYDWVLPNSNLNAVKTSTVYGSFNYANGLVFDTGDFSQPDLDTNFFPALASDSGASNMQHMGVVRTFLLPSETIHDGDGVTVSQTDRAVAAANPGSATPMLSVNLTASSNEWDAASIAINKLGTLSDANVAAKVYLDSNGNGHVDGGESLLGSSAFGASSATITLSPPPRGVPGLPIRLLCVADIAGAAPNGATIQYQLVNNGILHSATGGNDIDPTFSLGASGTTTVNTSVVSTASTGTVVINKFFNGSTANLDAMELLVIEDGLDMRGMIVKDFSSSMANDGGGKFTFSNDTLWSSVREGTMIVLRNDSSAADVTATGSDFNLDVGMGNTTYFTNSGGTFDIGGTDMVIIKEANSGAAGVTSSIHCLAAGNAGAQYTGAPSPKIRATSGASNGQFAYVANTNAAATQFSRLSNYDDANGVASGGVTTPTLGTANNQANQDFITFLRGTTVAPPSNITATGFQANWTGLVTATSYRLDVATDSSFSNILPDFNNRNVGSGTSFFVLGLSGGTYYYRVRGSNAEGTQSRNSDFTSALVENTGFSSYSDNTFVTSTGWQLFGTVNTSQSVSFDGAKQALLAQVSSDSGNNWRLIGWITQAGNTMPYSVVGTDKFIRSKFFVYAAGQTGTGINEIPNFRLRIANRFAVTSLLTVNNHLNADPEATALGEDIRPSTAPLSPSIYRVDMDPIDVPQLVNNPATEGFLAAFEAYEPDPQANGSIALTELVLGTYPALGNLDPNSTSPQNGFLKQYLPGVSDGGDFGTGNIANSNSSGITVKYFNGAVDAAAPQPGFTVGPEGVTLETLSVESNRLGIAAFDVFNTVEDQTSHTARARFERDMQYKFRFHATSTQNSNAQALVRFRARTIKFMYTASLEIGGATGASIQSNAIASQALPGVGNMIPAYDRIDANENGGWYNVVMSSPLNEDIQFDQPHLSAQDPPGVDTSPGDNKKSRRDLQFGFDVIDTFSTQPSSGSERGHMTVDQVDIMQYDLVPD